MAPKKMQPGFGTDSIRASMYLLEESSYNEVLILVDSITQTAGERKTQRERKRVGC